LGSVSVGWYIHREAAFLDAVEPRDRRSSEEVV
jgi:hypothetical protein